MESMQKNASETLQTQLPLILNGHIQFKIRFNTMHGDTDFYWRVILAPKVQNDPDVEYLVRSVRCKVETYSDASFDARAGKIKFNMAGVCGELRIDEGYNCVIA